VNISIDGLNLLKSVEALRLDPYDDDTGRQIKEWCPGATIGYGHLIGRREWVAFRDDYLTGITEHHANCMLDCDLDRFEDAVNEGTKHTLSQNQFDALVIFAFNIGVNGFLASSALKLINDSHAKTPYRNIEHAWKAWNKETKDGIKVRSQGLVNRRNSEWNIYSKGIYNGW